MHSRCWSAHRLRAIVCALQMLRVLAACDRDGLDAPALRDPATCQGCHPDQFREWSGSMHAYASDDPVFRAMNARGQRETGGALGTQCLQCHAPMAVRDRATTDGGNLADLPRDQQGVTCAFCHTIDDVAGDVDNPLVLARDGVMHGQLSSPMQTEAHASAHSPWLDAASPSSARACGACHDVVTQNGVAIETTFAEWRGSLYAQPSTLLTCAECHMKGRDATAADVPGAPKRRVSSHMWAALDQAKTGWPETAAQRAAIASDLEPSVSAKLCVDPGGAIDVTLDNVLAGHAWPSGVTHSRRAWVEVTATAAGVSMLDDQAWVLGQTLRGADGQPVAMPWEAAAADSVVLPPAVTVNPQDPRFFHAVTRHYAIPPQADHIVLRVWMQPIAAAILDDLVRSGDLAPELAAPTTFEITTAHRDWTPANGYGCR